MIELKNLTLRAGDFVLSEISLSIPSGEYVVLMGRTGCGKSTILESICGLLRPDQGTIRIDDRDVTKLPPGQRGVGYVPQDAVLFPSMTVRRQLGFALELRRTSPKIIAARTEQLAELLRITHLLDRLPKGLSGGESQRIALGRALSFEPSVLCLDEPLSALDDATRDEMYDLLIQVREHTQVTTLHVTHHRVTAERLAHRILVLDAGRIRQTTLSPDTTGPDTSPNNS